MEEEVDMLLAGVFCDKKENVCKAWWLITKDGKTIDAELKIPIKSIAPTPHEAELKLEDMLKDTVLKVSGLRFRGD